MAQKRRCWSSITLFALLAGGVRVSTLLGPASLRPTDPFAGAAVPALHASFAAATDVTARDGWDDLWADASDDQSDGADPRTFTADPIYVAIHNDPLAVHARGGVLHSGGKTCAIGNPTPRGADAGRASTGADRATDNPVTLADSRWGGGAVGPLAAGATSGTDSSDPRRTPTGGRHPADHDGAGQFPPDLPPPVITLPDPSEFPDAVGIPTDPVGPIGVVGAPPPPALHAVPLPAPLALGLSGLALAAASARKRLAVAR